MLRSLPPNIKAGKADVGRLGQTLAAIELVRDSRADDATAHSGAESRSIPSNSPLV
jgi:hypothetical protein